MNFTADLHLETDRVLLRPLREEDITQLQTIAFDADTWKYMITSITTPESLSTWATNCLAARQNQQRYTFVIIDKATGNLAGSTSFGNISGPDKRLEVGWTWLGKTYRGTGLNRHCKFMLLSYVFEVLNYERVELKTDVQNLRSRQAMQKIGATEEGILRSHTLMHDGRRRDTIYYSILRSEWPAIRDAVFTDLNYSCTQR
jgi:N-acetyltransferase